MFVVTVCIVHLFERRCHPHYGKGSLQGPVTGSRRVPQAQIRRGDPPGAEIRRGIYKETARWQIITDKELVCES